MTLEAASPLWSYCTHTIKQAVVGTSETTTVARNIRSWNLMWRYVWKHAACLTMSGRDTQVYLDL
jgi:hypothetical protein